MYERFFRSNSSTITRPTFIGTGEYRDLFILEKVEGDALVLGETFFVVFLIPVCLKIRTVHSVLLTFMTVLTRVYKSLRFVFGCVK